MATAYTSLLGLALPVQGELQGTWGDTVNNSITSLLDTAVAGTTTLSTDADVTLTTTTGASNQARQAIILWTASGTTTRYITAPAQSKIYTVINKTGSTQSIVLRGVGPTTGVTIPAGSSGTFAWNGTDFVDVSNYVNGNKIINGNLTVNGTTTLKGNTTIGDATADTLTVTSTITSNLLFTDNTYDIGASGATRPRNLYLAGNAVIGGSTTLSGGTANGVAYLNGSKVLTTGSALTFDGTNFATTGSVTSAGASNSGNLTFTGTGNRITGDFSNATLTNRVSFQSSTTNGATVVQLIPNGTSTSSQFSAYGGSDILNTSVAQLTNNGTEVRIASGIFGTGTYLPMTFYTSGSEKLRIAADTTGTYTFGGTAPRITGDFSTATVANRVAFQTSTANSSTVVGVLPNGTGTTTALQVNNNSDLTAALAFGNLQASSTEVTLQSGIRNAGSYLPMTFYTGGSERMRIDTSGNVGIGTSSPTAPLTVVTPSGGLALQINGRSSDNLGGLYFYANNGTTSYCQITSSASEYRVASQSTAVQTFYTNGSERMRIDSSGNVGIGTTSPVAALSVAKQTTALSGTSQPYGVHIYPTSSGLCYIDALTSSSSNTSLGFRTYNNGTYNEVRIDSSGNVGIGTSSPSSKLDVYTASGSVTTYVRTAGSTGSDTANSYVLAGSTSLQNISYGSGYAYTLASASVAYTVGNAANAPVIFTTNNTERARIDTSGNLLVGGTTSTARITALGASTTSANIALYAGNSSGEDLFYARCDGYINTGSRTNSPYNNTTASAANMYVDSLGGLYRSTSSLKYKTDVQDAVHGLSDVMALRPVTYKGKNDGDTVFGGLIAEEVDAAGLTEFVQYAEDGSPDALAYGNMVSLCIKAIQELKAEFDAYKASHP